MPGNNQRGRSTVRGRSYSAGYETYLQRMREQALARNNPFEPEPTPRPTHTHSPNIWPPLERNNPSEQEEPILEESSEEEEESELTFEDLSVEEGTTDGYNISPDRDRDREIMRTLNSMGTTPRLYGGGIPSFQQFLGSPPSNTNGQIQEEFEMSTIADMYGLNFPNESLESHPLIVGTHRVGVEVELENIRDSYPASRYWRAISDGSLRNSGVEYVFRGPLGGKDLFEALSELDTFMHSTTPDASWRCSTHVHLDVRDMNEKQIKLLTLAYLVYEIVLFKCSGFHRYKNNFCPALGFAQQMIQVLSRAWSLEGSQFTGSVLGSWDKYSALNFLPMSSQGSVEFRLAEGKWRKGHLIKHCNRIISLKELAMSWEGTEEELVFHLLRTDPRSILTKGLSKNQVVELEDLEIGAKIALDIISVHKLRSKNLQPAIALPETPSSNPSFRTEANISLRRDVISQMKSSPRYSLLGGVWTQDLVEYPLETNFSDVLIAEVMLGGHFSRSWVLRTGTIRESYQRWKMLEEVRNYRELLVNTRDNLQDDLF